MNNPTNVFVTESNVELYLSKAYAAKDAAERDILLRLLVQEERRMGSSREHVENGERRLDDCKERVKRQREIVGTLHSNESRLQAELLLETFEAILVLMEKHQRVLVERFRATRL
jgi:hypothetical protein